MPITKNKLDKIAKIHTEEEGFESILQKYKIREISKFVQGKTMLDIGCGIGSMTKVFSGKFERVVGLDGSEIKIEKANRLNPGKNISYVHRLFEEYNPKDKFDFIVSTNVLEHVENSINFLKRVRRLLTKDGRVVMTVPNALGLHKRIGKKMALIKNFYRLTPSDISKGHKRIYDASKLKKDFEKSGFKINYIGGILLKPLSHKQMESWDPRVVDALYEIGHDLPDYCSSLIIVASIHNVKRKYSK